MAALTRGVRCAVAVCATALGAALASVASPTRALAQDSLVRASPVPDSLAPRELVVLAHGLGRTSRSMRPLAKALEAEGYEVLNFGYSSYCCTVAELGERLRTRLAERMGPQHTAVHFVGHSLGNILVRWVLTRDSLPPRVGRVVMIAPPNQGSHSADRFAPVVGWLLDPIGELRTDSTSTVRRLPPMVGIKVGIIAGRRDGKVTVDESHLPEETAHVVVDGYHTFLMRKTEVQQLTVAFLRRAEFSTPRTPRTPRTPDRP